MRRLTLLVVLVAFVFSCGGQWSVLQGIAWANMIREYSKEVPLAQAVEMTLSGKYPCMICKLIVEHKNSENSKIAAVGQQEKKILPTCLVSVAPSPSGTPQTFLDRDALLRSRSDSPPTPPPRLA